MDQNKVLGLWGKSISNLVGIVGVLVFGHLTTPLLHADTDPKYYAVMVSAQVQSSPAQITLQWSGDGNASGYEISRNNDGGWTPVANVGGGMTSWTDSNVSNGGAYEYRVVKSTSVGYKGTGYIYAGINAPLHDSHGKVIFLVDNSLSDALATELKRMEWDLAGDGWTVLRHDVSRNDTPPNIKSIIRNDYYSDPSNVKAVYIFGHVPVPYSGDFNPDGHPDHRGAWIADTYYGDMDGNWSDSSVNDTGAQRIYNKNSPGDGKFDQSDLPSDIEVPVGRVDFSNLTCYANKSNARSELDLARAYLNKDHNFRHRVFTVARRGLVCDNWGERNGEAFAASGWRNFGAFFGADNVTAVGGWQYFPTVTSQDYLWSWAGGGGGWYTCDGVGSSDDFATQDIKAVFTMFLGSYFGDWDNESGLLRSALGSGYCLTTSWAGRPHWFYHHMGLGEPIGVSARLTQNNRGMYENQQNYAAHQVHVTLLGDPTLRMHPVIPASNLQGSANGSTITLSWNGSGDNNVVGYHVYRGSGANAPFVRLTGSPISGTSFTDSSYGSGVTYMVRAIKLEQSGSGTYYNASQGMFYPANGNTGGGGTPPPPATPNAPANLAATAQSASQITLAWQDQSDNETSFHIDRKTGSSGAWAQIGTVGANATSFSDSGLAPGTTYYYRAFAVNSSGTSMPSNESSATTGNPNATPADASFAGTDASTSGNWKGTYGANGYNVISGSQSYPGYVAVNSVGADTYQWSDYTTETRALQSATAGNRFAAAWFAPSGFTVDFNFLDGVSHKLSLYFVDWDRQNRTEKIEILDAASGALLDSRTVSNFADGVYLSWSVKGVIRVRFTKIGGNNVLVNGLFFDSASGTAGNSDETGGTKAAGVVAGVFHLQITGNVGDKFDIYGSDNLLIWTKITTVTLTGPTYDFLDNTSNGKALRFYRAVATP